MTKRKALVLSLLGIAALGATAALTRQRGATAVASTNDPNQPDGLMFRLSEGKAPTGSFAAAVPAAAEKLSDAEADQLLSRLPLPKAQPGDVVDFAIREGSLPAPRAGQTVTTAFPPAPTELAKPVVETGPLLVRRMSPEGDVPAADRVSITFSQPMVPVTPTAMDENSAFCPNHSVMSSGTVIACQTADRCARMSTVRVIV